MELTKVFNNNVSAHLEKIEYNILETFDERNLKVDIADQFKLNEISHNALALTISRDIVLGMVGGFTLHIEVDFKRYAQDGVNLANILSEEIVEQNITEICGPVMNFVSLLISQITASFNRNPIITTPNFIVKEPRKEKQ